MLSCLIILVFGLTPALVSLWIYRQNVYRHTEDTPLRGWLQRPSPLTIDRFTPPPSLRPSLPERRYIPGLGYIIGNISCRFNARSGYLRCAVNPMGPCQGCSLYESVVIEPLGSESQR
ncbi:MAG: DUF6464 family protein [Elainellaceae cyanobacterium]